MEFLHSITSYLVIFDLLYASAVCFLKVCTYTRIKDLIFSYLEFFFKSPNKILLTCYGIFKCVWAKFCQLTK